MTKIRIGNNLRWCGFALEGISLVLLMMSRGKGRVIASMPLESVLYASLGVGFVLWFIGTIVMRIGIRQSAGSSRPMD